MDKIFLAIYCLCFTLIAKSQTADFTYKTSSGLFCNPSTIQFTEGASGNPQAYVWTFGDGTGSNSANPLITYTNAGSYTVKLIVIYASTTAVVTKTIVINPTPVTSIGFDRNYICTPGVINFSSASSASINMYSWDFGDASAIVNTSTNNITHNFSASGNYKVKLIATALSGCFDSTSTTIIVQPPPITGTASPTSGCVPAVVSFKANATVPVGSSVTNYTWNFGDGTPPISTIGSNTNHTYNTPGNYSPSVTIATSEGCTSKYIFVGIGFGIPPTNQVAYPVKNIICGSDSAIFVAKATNANTYYYNFNDGTEGNYPDTIVHYKFTTLGLKPVYILPLDNGCYSNPLNVKINVIGVIADYNYSNSCGDKKTFTFKNTSQGNLSLVEWDFGDGSTIQNTDSLTHTFPSTGSFVTKLTVTDSVTGCSDRFYQRIYIASPVLNNQDSSICKNSTTTFSVLNNYQNPSTKYFWHVVGQYAGPYNDSTFSISTPIFGNFNNYVVLDNGSQYCLDTIRLNHSILVKGPNLNFSAPSSICFNNLYNVLDVSQPYVPTDSVVVWYWNFGVNNLNDSVYQPQPFAYFSPGLYNVQLTGIDKNGCKDSMTKSVSVNPIPFLYVIPSIDTLCSGKTGSLFAFHSDSITWSPSNSLSCATCDTALANPTVSTKYLIKATSSFGCTITDSVFVRVYAPFSAATASTDIYICVTDTIRLNVEPPGKRIIWSPSSNLSGSTIYGPLASPTETTTYTATLVDSVGCFSSNADITVHIKTLPTVNAGPDKTYPFNSSFSINPIYSNNVRSYNWSPANLLSCTTCPDPSGIITNSNTYVIKVASDSGCIAADTISIFLECKDADLLIPTAFTPNNDNVNDYFYPIGRGLKTISRFSIFDRFGKLVYEAKNFQPNDQSFGWNGKVNNTDQPTSVFVYYIEAICDLGQKIYKKGSFVLIR